MKIGILTFQETNNFGSLAQTYGLYKGLLNIGMQTEVINYSCDEICRREFRYEHISSLNVKNLAKYLLFSGFSKKKHAALNAFLRNNAKLSLKSYSKSNISLAENEYDAIIVGSDLVWAPDVTNEDYTYFLDFSNNIKKISYASSANNIIDNDYRDKMVSMLSDFDYLSVRENKIQAELSELLHRDIYFVCDPTMLIESNEWIETAKKSKLNQKLKKRKYILMYFPDSEGKMLKDAHYLSKQLGLEIILINDSLYRPGIINRRVAKFEDFLCYILHADVVLSGSYHGTLFSLYFKKQFYYYIRAHASRMESLSSILGIENRSAKNLSLGENINYKDISKRIESFRNISKDYLMIVKDYLYE